MSTKTNTMAEKSTMSRDVSLALLVTVILCSINSTDAVINTDTILGCFPREYKFNASKTVVLKGQRLSCWDVVTVYSCWGRCDSFEYGDYKIPYRISYHPVCTYTGKASRQVRLRHCHPQFPDPFYKVFDATACNCKFCDSEHTSCENLNG